MCNIDQYRVAVQNLAENRINEEIHNLGPDHARIVCSSLFRNAEKSICIAAGDLCNTDVSCTDEYISAMEIFLSKDQTLLNILLTDYQQDLYNNPQTGRFLKRIISSDAYRQGRVIIKRSIGKKFNSHFADGTKKEFHFLIGDKSMYRRENDTIERAAICNFNDEGKTAELQTLFDSAFYSDDVELINFA